MQPIFKTGKTFVQTLTVAAIIAGRPLPEGTAPEILMMSPEEAFEAAEAAFREEGVVDKASYLAWRDRTRSSLRETAAEIRALKARIRPLDGNMSDYWSAASDLSAARDRFRNLHDARVLGKAWAGAARKRALSGLQAA